MSFKAVIFDLDGTILDTIQDIQDAVNHVLLNHGYPTRDTEYVRMAVGNGMRDLAKKCIPEELRTQDDEVDLCFRKIKEYYQSHWNIKTKPYDGICDFLDFLVNNNIPFCVLSNKPDSATQEIVPHYFGDYRFFYVSGEKEGIPRKPNPASSLALAEKLGVLPQEVLFVGDSSYDMMTAKNAGMFAAGVLWGFRDEEDLLKAGADFIAHFPHDLKELVKTYNCIK